MKQYKAQVHEVIIANHIREFSRFYDKHKTLCDEITGVKKRTIIEKGNPLPIEITRLNFHFAIKRLYAFIIDNIHYVTEKDKRNEIEVEINNIEQSFINDSDYNEYVKRNDSLVIDDKIKFNIKYFKYVLRCFELSGKFVKYLQNSLMINTKDIKKSISFFEYGNFFENLSQYRDEISNDLSDFRFKDILTHLKKIIGYHYTYRVFMLQTELEVIDLLINTLISYVLKEEFVGYIIKTNKNDFLTNDERFDIQIETIFIKQILSRIYVLMNESLSERNILPKVSKKELIDKTLI